MEGVKIPTEKGDTSCEDISRSGSTLADLAEPFCLFLQNCPFASAFILSQHFSVCVTTAKEIFVRDLGLTKVTQGWYCPTVKNDESRGNE
jgi:hypothetical protein